MLDFLITLEIEDFGYIDQCVDEIVDHGSIENDLGPRTCFIANVGISKDKNGKTGLKIKGSSITKKVSNFVPYVNLNDMDIVYCGIILRWIGFGTAFEFDNGIERIVSPYLASGTVR